MRRERCRAGELSLRTRGAKIDSFLYSSYAREAGSLCVCDLERGFGLSQPTVSHHLKLLRNAGILRGERQGTWIYYSLVPGLLELVAEHSISKR